MEYHTRKKIIISIIVILIIAALGYGAYSLFSTKASSCLDGLKNRDEEDVDCGGSYCDPCFIRDIEIVWQKAILTNTSINTYDFAAEISNPNSNFGLSEFNYSFIFKNSAGVKLGEKNGKAFILPGSKRYIIELNIQSQEPIAFLDLNVEKAKKSDWQKLKDYQSPQLYVKDKNIEIIDREKSLVQSSGVVKNDTYFDFGMVSAYVVIFGKNNQVVGVSKTEINTLKAGEERAFLVKIPLGEEIGEVPSYLTDMQAETNLFDNDNYMKKFGVLSAGS